MDILKNAHVYNLFDVCVCGFIYWLGDSNS